METTEKIRLFLDDVRVPENCLLYMHTRINNISLYRASNWVIVRNFEDFTEAVKYNYPAIELISLDHDLGEDVAIENRELGLSKRAARKSKKFVKSGYDCAVWLKQFYKEKNVTLPPIIVHSMNPVGTENIKNVFK